MTLKGKSVYQKITQSKSALESEQSGKSRELYAVEERIETLTAQREKAYLALAELYMPELREELIRGVFAKQHELRDLFAAKQKRRQQLEELTTTSQLDRENLVLRLDAVTQSLEKTVQAKDEAAGRVKNFLAEDTEYVRLEKDAAACSADIEELTGIAAAKKTEVAGKLREYEQNGAFMYLVERGFGAPSYKCNGLTRKLDTWLAGEHFAKNFRNYTTLQGLEGQIAGMIDAAKRRREQISSQMAERVKAAEERAEMPKILSEGQKLYELRTTINKSVQEADRNIAQYLSQRETLDSEEDPYLKKAHDELRAYMKGQDLAVLRQRARETATGDDDALVDTIEQLDADIRSNRKEASLIKETQAEIAKRLQRATTLQSEYCRRNYDSSDSRFRGNFEADDFLTGYLLGRITSDSLWQTMRQHHYVEEPPVVYTTPTYRSSHTTSSSDYTSFSSFGGGDHSTTGGFG